MRYCQCIKVDGKMIFCRKSLAYSWRCGPVWCAQKTLVCISSRNKTLNQKLLAFGFDKNW